MPPNPVTVSRFSSSSPASGNNNETLKGLELRHEIFDDSWCMEKGISLKMSSVAYVNLGEPPSLTVV